ncbi:hypothetical protein QBB33_15495 [Streptomyces scabiei]|uniref:hypothetical protein n=1 Tax=Streptomyces scabiei TaxID=1930 RepID=UPI002FF31C17
MSEATAEEREEQLVKLRRRMGRALKRDDAAGYDRLSAVYARLKAEHVTKVHAERMAERRAARAAQRARQRTEGPERWRLPRGFGMSPLARERARSGWRPREEPSMPAGGLRPWRRGAPMSEVIWRP